MSSHLGLRTVLAPAACAAALALAGCSTPGGLTIGGKRGVLSMAGYRSAQAKTRAQVPAGDARELKARSEFGSIDVDAAADQTFSVEAEVSVSGPYPETQLQNWADGTKVEVGTDGPRREVRLKPPAGIPGNASVTASYRIRAPRTLALDLRSANGSVTAQHVGGTVHAESAFGAVAVTDVHGNVFAHSSNGSVKVERVVGDVDAGSSFGSVDLTAIQGAIHGKSDNGAVKAGATQAAQNDVDLKSGFGEVQFAGSAGKLTATSNNGSVRLELQNTPRETRGTSSFGSVEAAVPPGVNADLEADSGFGAVEIRNVNGVNSRGSGTGSQHWTGRLGSGGSSMKLHSGNGSVTLRQR